MGIGKKRGAQPGWYLFTVRLCHQTAARTPRALSGDNTGLSGSAVPLQSRVVPGL